jgi:hypothetical protein
VSEPRSEWTFESLYALLRAKIAAQEKLTNERFTGSDRVHRKILFAGRDASRPRDTGRQHRE